jgi:hypothetical protein
MEDPSVAIFSPESASFWLSSEFPAHAAVKHKPPGARALMVPHKKRRANQTTSGTRVLLFGRIRELALYRAEVLRDRGFSVTIPGDKREIVEIIRRGELDVAVLSYTLPSDLVQEIAELVREHCPGCALVAISDTGRIDRKVDPDETVIADDGPPALIAALRRVTRRS